MANPDQIYVDGAWIPSTGKGTIDVIGAYTEEVIGTVPEGTAEDVDKTVRAARRPFTEWSQTSVEDRGKSLQRIAEGLTARTDEIANIISSENGMPLILAKLVQAGRPTGNFGIFSTIAASYEFTEQIGTSLIVKEPVGVVGCITP